MIKCAHTQRQREKGGIGGRKTGREGDRERESYAQQYLPRLKVTWKDEERPFHAAQEKSLR